MTKVKPSNCSKRVISWPRIKINWLYRFPVEKVKILEVQYERKTYALIKIQTFKIPVDSLLQYEDKVEASTILADEYINQVYFSGQRRSKRMMLLFWELI